jgi:hypothetical protein
MANIPYSPPGPVYAPSSGGDGASPAVDASERQAKVRSLVNEETGLRFEPLVLFAEPLFDMYDLDPGEAFALRQNPDDADEAVVAVVEAARLLWAYFRLSPAEQLDRHATLASFLLGPEHSIEEEADLEHLIDRMREQWDLLMPEDRQLAESAEAPTLGFDDLVAHPAFAAGHAVEERGTYGPENLSELEAQALFAQPLLDSASEPDEMEAALERASAYWELAHRRGAVRESLRSELVQQFGITAGERRRIEKEADEMLARFDQLFPEHRA